MLNLGEVFLWSAVIVAAIGFLTAATIAYLALLRWLVIVVPAIVVVGFAFEPGLQLRFTAVLIGLLTILYLPPLFLAWAWRQVMRLRSIVSCKADFPSVLEMAHQTFAEETARSRLESENKAASIARAQDERASQTRDLNQQGMFSLWRR